MNRVFLLVVFAISVALAVSFGSAPAAWTQDDEETMDRLVHAVDIVASDFRYAPATLSVNAGPVTFNILNQGMVEHDLAIEDTRRQILARSPIVPAGSSGNLDVTLISGTYTLVCTLPAHRETGMVGTLTVNP